MRQVVKSTRGERKRNGQSSNDVDVEGRTNKKERRARVAILKPLRLPFPIFFFFTRSALTRKLSLKLNRKKRTFPSQKKKWKMFVCLRCGWKKALRYDVKKYFKRIFWESHKSRALFPIKLDLSAMSSRSSIHTPSVVERVWSRMESSCDLWTNFYELVTHCCFCCCYCHKSCFSLPC